MSVVQIRVLYGDTDRMGVVYYANYLRWFEAGRNEFIRERGVPYRDIEARGYSLPVVEVGCLYRSPARYDDVVEVETRLGRGGRTTVKFEYTVRDKGDGRVLAEGFTVHALVGPDGKPARLPDDLASALAEAA